MNGRIKSVVFVVLCLLASASLAFAQPGTDPNDGAAPGTPITGIEILIAIGGLLGAKKIFISKSRTKR
jgi:hypothetical protein